MVDVLTPTEAREVLTRLADAARADVPDAWAAGTQLMLGWDARTWLAVDDLARRWSSYGGPIVAGSQGWPGASLAEASGFVATVTSMHSDGRVREHATAVLAVIPGRLSASALAVRALDHVAEVRAKATNGLAREAADPHAEAVFSILLARGERRHAQAAIDVVLGALLKRHSPEEIAERLIASSDRATRRWAYRFAHTQNLLNAEHLMRVVATDADQGLRTDAATWLAPIATAAQLHALLRGRSAIGRIMAVHALAEEDLDDRALVDALCDPAARVRRVAQWRAGRRGVDPAPVYRGYLARSATSPRRLAAALDALGEIGTPQDVAAIAPYLSSPRVPVRNAATAAIGALSEGSQLQALLVPLLLDPSPRITRSAARALIRGGTPARLAEQAWAAHDQPWSRRAAWQVMRSTTSWGSLVADLLAASDEDPLLQQLGTLGLRNWLRTTAAHTYQAPTPDQLIQIERLLPYVGLDTRQRHMVAFHAGLARGR
jgi:hypothetical protein